MFVHNFDPVFVDLGLIQIRWYSLSYILGIVVGWIYAKKIIEIKLKDNQNISSISAKKFDDIIVYLILGIIIGGRLGYIFFYNFEYYINNILDIFKIWKGGMSFHGGLAGIIISTIFYCQKTKNNFFEFSDIVACVAPIGIFLGRIANFINGELYGKISNVPWSVIFPSADSIARHPSQIYEAILEGVVLFIIINYFALKKKLLIKKGYISGLFLILYSIFRIFAEGFREPDPQVGYFFDIFSMGTLLSLVTLALGIFITFYVKKNEQNI